MVAWRDVNGTLMHLRSMAHLNLECGDFPEPDIIVMMMTAVTMTMKKCGFVIGDSMARTALQKNFV
jgi:hypothetical protein